MNGLFDDIYPTYRPTRSLMKVLTRFKVITEQQYLVFMRAKFR